MKSVICKIKEWIFGTLCHSDNSGASDSRSNTPEVVIPMPNDESLPEFKGIGDADQKEYEEETGTDELPNTLSVGSEVGDSINVKFDDIEPVTPMEVTIQKEGVNDEPQKGVKAFDKSVNDSKLVVLTVDSIKYYDKLRSQMPTDDLRNILDDVCRKLIDNLIMAGCTPINEELGCFDMSRHRVEPFQLVEDGTPYSKLIRKGVEFQNEVKLLAIVEL